LRIFLSVNLVVDVVVHAIVAVIGFSLGCGHRPPYVLGGGEFLTMTTTPGCTVIMKVLHIAS
jgi:hypothetical protein